MLIIDDQCFLGDVIQFRINLDCMKVEKILNDWIQYDENFDKLDDTSSGSSSSKIFDPDSQEFNLEKILKM